MCFSCLEPRRVGKLKNFVNHINVPKVFEMLTVCFMGGVRESGAEKISMEHCCISARSSGVGHHRAKWWRNIL